MWGLTRYLRQGSMQGSAPACPSCSSPSPPTSWARAYLLQDLADGFVLIHLLPRQNLLEPLIHLSHAATKTAHSFTLSTFSEHLLCARHLGGDQDKPFIHSAILMERLLGVMLQAGQTQSLSESHGLEGGDRVCVWERGDTHPSAGIPPPR